MSLWPDTAAKMLNEQYDIYEKAREEYRNKIAKQADRIQQLEKALQAVDDEHGYGLPPETRQMIRAALEEEA